MGHVGFDLCSAYDYTVLRMEKNPVKTDIHIAFPSECYGRVAPHSGLTAKHLIDIGAGVIGEDYIGNTGIVLFNFGKEKFEVKKVTELHSSCMKGFFIQK